MKDKVQKEILTIINRISDDDDVKKIFVARILEGCLTRDENPLSHICVYFAGYDPIHKEIFIGHHKKSGLWLFNGGHLDQNESLIEALSREIKEEWGFSSPSHIPSPSLLTITQIENPFKQKCQTHFDIWFFLPFNKDEFMPNEISLATEFTKWSWQTIDESSHLIKDLSTQRGINKIAQLF